MMVIVPILKNKLSHICAVVFIIILTSCYSQRKITSENNINLQPILNQFIEDFEKESENNFSSKNNYIIVSLKKEQSSNGNNLFKNTIATTRFDIEFHPNLGSLYKYKNYVIQLYCNDLEDECISKFNSLKPFNKQIDKKDPSMNYQYPYWLVTFNDSWEVTDVYPKEKEKEIKILLNQ